MRHIISHLKEYLTDFTATLLIGARQVGKSTMAQQLVKSGILKSYVTLDDPTVLAAARSDPDNFLESLPDQIALDEIQRVPDLLRALKKNIDKDKRPGRFLLTGSANVLAHPNVSESLAGRMGILHLEGFSVAEIQEQITASKFIDNIFTNNELNNFLAFYQAKQNIYSSIDKIQLANWIYFGGYPELALRHNINFTQRWLAAYQSAYIERDVRDLAQGLDVFAFSKLVKLAGLRSANLLNIKNLALDAGIDQRTASRYLELMALTFQAHTLQPWYSNSNKRLVKTPKLYCQDSAQACFYAGISNPQQILGHPNLGYLLETWVYAELRKLLSLHIGINIYFYRTHLGHEVDFVLEKGEQYRGIEIKMASHVTRKDFSGLLDLQSAVNNKNFLGLILYNGDQVVRFSPNLAALPLSCMLF